MRKDVQNRDDIDKAMRLFYDKLFADEAMYHLFVNVIQIDLKKHFPILVDFWDNILFYSGTYQRNAMEKHFEVNDKIPLTPDLFKTWLKLFNEAFDELFKGEKTEMAKERAKSIAVIMEMKMNNLNGINIKP